MLLDRERVNDDLHPFQHCHGLRSSSFIKITGCIAVQNIKAPILPNNKFDLA